MQSGRGWLLCPLVIKLMLVILNDNRHPHPLDTENGRWVLNTKAVVVVVMVGVAET